MIPLRTKGYPLSAPRIGETEPVKHRETTSRIYVGSFSRLLSRRGSIWCSPRPTERALWPRPLKPVQRGAG